MSHDRRGTVPELTQAFLSQNLSSLSYPSFPASAMQDWATMSIQDILPYELIKEAISYLSFDDPSLKACALVCHTFHEISIPFTLKDLRLRNSEHAIQFAHTLQNSPYLGGLVQNVELSHHVLCYEESRLKESNRGAGLKEAMLYIFSRLSNIKGLHFRFKEQIYWKSVVNGGLLQYCYSTIFPNITTLSFCRVSLLPLVDIIGACKKLETLSLASFSTDYAPWFDGPSLPAYLPLKTLILWHWDESDFLRGFSLTSILSRAKLGALELRQYPSPGFNISCMEPAVQGQFATLRRLFLGSEITNLMAQRTDWRDVGDLGLCRYKVLQVLHLVVPILDTLATSKLCAWLASQIDKLPRSYPLRYLVFDVPHPVWLEEAEHKNIEPETSWQALEAALYSLSQLQRFIIRLPLARTVNDVDAGFLERILPMRKERKVLQLVYTWGSPDTFPGSYLNEF